ncbi:type-F conjugative transfer system secretin TraK [uncultured Thiobacillus sp.]|mgnify:CR=1 FL=1|uniref:type-F conjugative transfer system secretin TraK n=1 Tax=uncultured Thiobacillus sp. TaxID=189996 RepID=UPI002606AC11|nr:type-F conjugative transfer system secretin TraK [uncultured Thiobacillus sp.]
MIHSRPNLRSALGSLLLLASAQAHAMQILDVADGATAYAKMSSGEITRLTINNGRIASWQVPKGRLVIQKNAKTGELYVRPLNREEPTSLFVTSESGATYAITLQPVSMPSETIVLRESPVAAAPEAEKSGSRSEGIKAFMLAMAADRLPADMDVRESGQTLTLWEDSRLTLVRSWIGARWVGERFDLTNTGKSPLRVAEAELFRDDVLAIAIEKHELAPGDTTRVFVLRLKGGES